MRRFSKFSVMCATLLAALAVVCMPARGQVGEHNKSVLQETVSAASVHERVADLGYFMIQSEESHLKIGWDGSDDTVPEVFDANTFEDLFSFVVREESKISIEIFASGTGDMLVVTFVINSVGELVITVSTDAGYRGERWTIPSGEGAEALLSGSGRGAKCACHGPSGVPTSSCSTVACDADQECSNQPSVHYCEWESSPSPSPKKEAIGPVLDE